jgi:hypothetical protein
MRERRRNLRLKVPWIQIVYKNKENTQKKAI